MSTTFAEIAGTIEGQFDIKTETANALLIKAAPALLAALQAVLRSSSADEYGTPDLVDLFHASNAIRLATGELAQ